MFIAGAGAPEAEAPPALYPVGALENVCYYPELLISCLAALKD